jgi:hypothetical protein
MFMDLHFQADDFYRPIHLSGTYLNVGKSLSLSLSVCVMDTGRSSAIGSTLDMPCRDPASNITYDALETSAFKIGT